MKHSIKIHEKDIPAFELILSELDKARAKHPTPYRNRSPLSNLSLLAEEVGEVAKDINEAKCYKLETAQTCVVCIRMISGV